MILFSIGFYREIEIEKLYFQHEYQKLIPLALQIVEEEPVNREIQYMLGHSLVEVGETERAIPYLKQLTLEKDENTLRQTWALAYLGGCLFLQDDPQAIKYFQRCFNLRNSNKAVFFVRQFGFDPYFLDWDIIESEHFIFHFPIESLVVAQSDYIKKHEIAFAKINNYFGTSLPRKIHYFVWNSCEDAVQVLGYSLGFANPRFSLVHVYYQQSIGHEMTHLITYYYRQPICRVGLINEGLAVYFDQSGENKLKLAKKLRPNKISIRKYWLNWQTNKFSYAMAGAFVEFLLKKEGQENMLALVVDQSYGNALKIYGAKLERLISEFERDE